MLPAQGVPVDRKEHCGFHAFRRFRVTFLRKSRVLEDLMRFWIGHADKSVTDGYSRVREELRFARCVRRTLGSVSSFRLKIQKPEVTPYCTHSELLSSVA
jgi:hypothetical protein